MKLALAILVGFSVAAIVLGALLDLVDRDRREGTGFSPQVSRGTAWK